MELTVQKSLMRGRVSLVLAAMVGLLAAVGISLTLALKRQPELQAATLFPEPVAVPEFALTDHEGDVFDRESLVGQTSLLFFGFTQCPDICPVTLQQLAVVRRKLEESGGAVIPQIVFISVDPARDDVDTLAAYVGAFGKGVQGARGELNALNVLTQSLGVFHARPETDDGYDVEHTSAVLIINPDAEFAGLFRAPHVVEDIVADWPGLVRQL